jgi:hypothetical protein
MRKATRVLDQRLLTAAAAAAVAGGTPVNNALVIAAPHSDFLTF